MGGCGWCGSASLLTTLGTPAHYTQVMSGAKEHLAAVAQAVTTGLGASSCDVVLVSLTESAMTEARKGGLGPARSRSVRDVHGSGRAEGRRGRRGAIAATGNRGPPSSGIY